MPEPLDLEPIKERLALARTPAADDFLDSADFDVAALIAEVERLRGEHFYDEDGNLVAHRRLTPGSKPEILSPPPTPSSPAGR